MISFKSTFKRDSLRKWYTSPIWTYEGLVKDKEGKNIRHADFTSQLYHDIVKILDKHDYAIEDKKRFRKELIRYIYKLSDDSS